MDFREKSYADFLSDTAIEVNGLVNQNRGRFEEQCVEFVRRYDHWRSKVREGQEAAKDDPKLNIGREPADDGSDEFINSQVKDKWWEEKNKNKPDGYRAYSRNDLDGFVIEEIEGYYYAPELPLNPVDTLRPRQIEDILIPSVNTHIQEREPVDRAENLLGQYFLLSLIHANISKGWPVTDKENEAAHSVWFLYKDMAGNKVYLERKARILITTALQDVKADLELREGKMEEPKQIRPEKTITDYALEVDEAIRKNPATKQYLRERLAEFCEAVENRIENTLPIIRKAVAAMKKSPLPYIREIEKIPADKRTSEQEAKIQEYKMKMKVKCPHNYKQLCQKAWWDSISDEMHKILSTRLDQLNQKQKQKLENHKKEYNKSKACPGGYKHGNEFYFQRYIKNPLEGYGVNCCLPIKPVNPIGWFPSFDDTFWYENYYDSLDAQDERTRNAVILAVIHDYSCTRAMEIKNRVIYKDTVYSGKHFERDKFLRDLWNRIKGEDEVYMRLVKTAMEDMAEVSNATAWHNDDFTLV